MKINKLQKGFTLLFASLVVSLVLSIGIAIANITLVQLTLSSAGRESQIAIYNADTALECALYHEYNKFVADSGALGGYRPFFPQSITQSPENMLCAQIPNDPGPTIYESGSEIITIYKFNFDYSGEGGNSCDSSKPSFLIEVSKTPRDATTYDVVIHTRGYNACDSNNPRRVERGLYVTGIIE